ncbi:hypothetical protein K438DRAFT_741312 [Mycena galopus ATCC 62051]|nr:hypothetical protein K438DRAFT_741312 [Mycena galopus ATCC 62051]
MYDYLNNSVRRYFAGKREPLRAALEGLNFLVVTAPSFAYFSLAVPLRHRNGGPILDNDSENIMYGLLSVLAVFALCLASARWGVVCSPGFEANVMMTTVFNAMGASR